MKKILVIAVALSSLALVGCGQTPEAVQVCINYTSSAFGESGAKKLCEIGYENVKSGEITLEQYVETYTNPLG